MLNSTLHMLFPFHLGWLALACCVVFTATGNAGEPDVVEQHSREFQISIDGKPRGSQTITITRHSDHSEVVHGQAEVVMNFVVYRYRYFSVGSETWKDGKLIGLTNEADFNGDKYVIRGSLAEQVLQYKVNGESRRAPTDIWAASYWREPEAARVGKKVRVLDTDKGRQLFATLERVGSETITAEAAQTKATHYRMRGDVEVDVWYDRHGCLAKQESVESGHRTQLELVRIRR